MKRTLRVLSGLLTVVGIVFGFMAHIRGGMPLNLGFWSTMLVAMAIQLALSQRRYWVRRGLILAGACSNATVVLANGGYMPVFAPGSYPHGIWVQLNVSHRLIFLADINKGSSVGDMLIASGILLALGYWVRGQVKKQLGLRRRARFDEQVRRLAGVGA